MVIHYYTTCFECTLHTRPNSAPSSSLAVGYLCYQYLLIMEVKFVAFLSFNPNPAGLLTSLKSPNNIWLTETRGSNWRFNKLMPNFPYWVGGVKLFDHQYFTLCRIYCFKMWNASMQIQDIIHKKYSSSDAKIEIFTEREREGKSGCILLKYLKA